MSGVRPHGPPRRANPEIGPGCYDLHVYCDRDVYEYDHEHMEAFIGANRAEARRAAREAGWRLNPDGTATCQICLRQGSCPL